MNNLWHGVSHPTPCVIQYTAGTRISAADYVIWSRHGAIWEAPWLRAAFHACLHAVGAQSMCGKTWSNGRHSDNFVPHSMMGFEVSRTRIVFLVRENIAVPIAYTQ